MRGDPKEQCLFSRMCIVPMVSFMMLDSSQRWRTMSTVTMPTPARCCGCVDWGILSTPVIDSTTAIGWVVSWNSIDGTMANAHYTLHGIRLDSGADATSPISLDTATYQPPGSFPLQHLNGVARKQRCGLLMTTINGVKTIFIGAGSFLESASTNQGWVIAVDVTNSAKPFVSAAWCSSIKFGGSGIWQGGQGLTADTDGYIYG